MVHTMPNILIESINFEECSWKKHQLMFFSELYQYRHTTEIV